MTRLPTLAAAVVLTIVLPLLSHYSLTGAAFLAVLVLLALAALWLVADVVVVAVGQVLLRRRARRFDRHTDSAVRVVEE